MIRTPLTVSAYSDNAIAQALTAFSVNLAALRNRMPEKKGMEVLLEGIRGGDPDQVEAARRRIEESYEAAGS